MALSGSFGGMETPQHISTDYNAHDGRTDWYALEGETYGVNGGVILDCDGVPVVDGALRPAAVRALLGAR